MRPEGQDDCDQLTLGLVSCATYNRVPMMSLITWKLINLTKLGFDEPLTCTSIQLSRNVESRLHVDKNTQGDSYITGLGNYEHGETFFYDAENSAPDRWTMKNKIRHFGDPGTVLHGHAKQIKNKVITFNGKLPHGTLPFVGERYALILFSVGTSVYNLTSALN